MTHKIYYHLWIEASPGEYQILHTDWDKDKLTALISTIENPNQKQIGISTHNELFDPEKKLNVRRSNETN